MAYAMCDSGVNYAVNHHQLLSVYDIILAPTIDANPAPLITPHFQHHLKKFL